MEIARTPSLRSHLRKASHPRLLQIAGESAAHTSRRLRACISLTGRVPVRGRTRLPRDARGVPTSQRERLSNVFSPHRNNHQFCP